MKDQAQPKTGTHATAGPADRASDTPPRKGPARTSKSGPSHAAPAGSARPPAGGRHRKDPLAYQPLRIVEGGAVHGHARPPRPGHAGGHSHRRNRHRIPPAVLWNARFRGLRNLLFATLVAEVLWLALTSPLLVVHRVTVTGAHIRPSKEIVRVAGLTQPGNIFRAPTGRAARRLLALPEVASVRVERRMPDTLAMVVGERRAAASVLTKGGCWVIDPGGLVFRQVSKPLPNRPVLVVEPRGKVALGKPLPLPALPSALKCVAQLSGLPLARNVRFHVDATQEAWLNNPDGFKVRLGPLDDAPERLALTGRILNGPDGPEVMKKVIALDMTTPNSEVYRPRQDSGESRLSGNL